MIKKFIEDRGFGYIQVDGSRSDVWFHHSAMAGGSEPKVDMVVEFIEEPDPRSGRLLATTTLSTTVKAAYSVGSTTIGGTSWVMLDPPEG